MEHKKIKPCNECIHYDNGYCYRPTLEYTNYVTGEITKLPLAKSCSYERDDNIIISFLFNSCGRNGKYWERKEDVSNT